MTYHVMTYDVMTLFDIFSLHEGHQNCQIQKWFWNGEVVENSVPRISVGFYTTQSPLASSHGAEVMSNSMSQWISVGFYITQSTPSLGVACIVEVTANRVALI